MRENSFENTVRDLPLDFKISSLVLFKVYLAWEQPGWNGLYSILMFIWITCWKS